MQYVSRPQQWAPIPTADGYTLDVDNHLVKERTRSRELVSWCGQIFGTLPDGDVSDMNDIAFARMCSRCLKAVKDATGVVPQFEGKIWRSIW